MSLTMTYRIALLLFATIGSIFGWWGWSTFWFALAGGITLQLKK